ncbi:hypothetical protein F5880DRAFT_1093351 [Lentinula raphanica]|nr:hypothetical protein F5880DRAFT_1093351 [Lentinula raphanica]
MAEALNNSEIDSISDDEYSALTDVPIFLGYILSYFLSGILVVQFFLYFLAFYHKDPRHIKLTVFAVLVIELLSTIVATVIGLIAIVEDGFLSNAILSGGFKVLALMSGIACSIVQFFYCWRIHILGGHNMIIVVVMLLSVLQCVMISLSGFGVFQNGDILGAGDRTIKDPTILFINISWLAGTAVCDIIIAVTILYLQNRIITMQCPSIRWKMRAEKVMSIAIDSGMVTAIGATIELLIFVVWRDSLLHFILFYALPKLYANCLMATLNARLVLSGGNFRESACFSKSIIPVEDQLFPSLQDPERKSHESSLEAQDIENPQYSTVNEKRNTIASVAPSNLTSTTYHVHLDAPTKRNSIVDLKNAQDRGHTTEVPLNLVTTFAASSTVSDSDEAWSELIKRRHSIIPTTSANSDDVEAYGNLGFPLESRLVHSKSDPNLSTVMHVSHLEQVYVQEQLQPADTTRFSAVVKDPNSITRIQPIEESFLKFGRDSVITAPVYGPFPLKLEPLRAPEASLQPKN